MSPDQLATRVCLANKAETGQVEKPSTATPSRADRVIGGISVRSRTNALYVTNMSMGQTAATDGDNQEMQPVEAKPMQVLLIYGVDKTEPAQSTQDLLSHVADEREPITQKDPKSNY